MTVIGDRILIYLGTIWIFLMPNAVYTLSDDRLTKKKEVPSSGATFDIRVDTLEELNNTEKVERLYKEIKKLYLEFLFNNPYHTESFPLYIPSPVYVRRNEAGEEVVVYRSNLMELNKLYEIEWQGEKWALRRTERDVELLKGEPETEGNK